MADENFFNMYEDEDDGPVEQPIQLRLAAKATVVSLAGKKIPVPKIEYVEGLEVKVQSLEQKVAAMESEMKALRRMLGGTRDHVNQAIKAVQRDVAEQRNNNIRRFD